MLPLVDFLGPVKATTIFSDDFESGNFNAWSGTDASSGEVVNASTNTINGTYAMQVTTDASGYNEYGYAYRSVSAKTELWASCYYKEIVAFPPEYWQVATVMSFTNGTTGFMMVRVGVMTASVGNTYWYMEFLEGATYYDQNDDARNYNSSTSVQLDTVYKLTLHAVIDGSVGEYEFLVNGVRVLNVTDIDTDNYGAINTVGVGMPRATAQYAHSHVVDDAEIYDAEEEPPEGVNWMGLDLSGDYNVTAANGTRAGLQAAHDDVIANGSDTGKGWYGNVFIPAGTHEDNWTTTLMFDGGVNFFGADPAGCHSHNYSTPWLNYTGTTIIRNINMPTDSNEVGPMIVIDGGNDKRTTIAGIVFTMLGPVWPEHDWTPYQGEATILTLVSSLNFRVHHCDFINGTYMSFESTTNGWPWGAGGNHSAYGVIDHCVVNNEYKVMSAGDWGGGYGFDALGDMVSGENYIDEIYPFAGKFESIENVSILYVEDCKFHLCRHAVDQSSGGAIVSRFSYYPEPADYFSTGWSIGEICGHGGYGSGDSAGVLLEAYNNTVVGPADFISTAYRLRGGHGLCYYNNFATPGDELAVYSVFCELGWDGGPNTVTNTYIWDNDYENCTFLKNTVGLIEDTDYFLRAPNFTLDGWTYTPYPYPIYEELGEQSEPPEYTYFITLTVNSPQNTTYTSSSISVSLSVSGNDSTPVYNWNAYFPNSSALYVSNQTSSSATMTITENATDVLFACGVTGEHSSTDYSEVYFSTNITLSEEEEEPYSEITAINNFFTYLYLSISMMCFIPMMLIGVFFYKGGYQNPKEASNLVITLVMLALIWLILMLFVASIQASMG